MIYLFLIACVCVYFFAPDSLSLGVSTDALGNAFCYQFAHASLVHLGINIFSLILMYKPIFNIYELRFGESSGLLHFFVVYIGSVLAALFTAYDIPTVGASGMVFFLLGELLMLRPTKKQLAAYIYVALAIVVQLIRGGSNVALHLIAFAFGMLFIIIRLLCIRNTNQ